MTKNPVTKSIKINKIMSDEKRKIITQHSIVIPNSYIAYTLEGEKEYSNKESIQFILITTFKDRFGVIDTSMFPVLSSDLAEGWIDESILIVKDLGNYLSEYPSPSKVVINGETIHLNK